MCILKSLFSTSFLKRSACTLTLIATAWLQNGVAESVPTGSTIVSHVYVSYTPGGSPTNKIMEFAAAANGTLTAIPGSPYFANVGSMAVTGTYLFGSNMTGNTVASFRVQPNGSLHWVNSTNVQTPDPTGCVYSTPITLDHTGATLYRVQFSGGLCDHNHYQSFWIDKSTGKLHYLGKSADAFLFDDPLSFTASNQFAYGSECLNFEGNPLDTFAGYRRMAGGLLDSVAISAPDPTTKDPSHFYCRAFTAGDPTNHLAVTFTDTDFNNPFSSPPTQLGVYTQLPSGDLTTTSTWSNMPATDVGYVFGLAMSPGGKLLAVAGMGGLQVFYFNGASPITHYTGLLTTDSIDRAFWDYNNHLFALSTSAGKLYVFTVTSTSVSAAPGSPHAITSPVDLIVQPLTDSDGDWDHD